MQKRLGIRCAVSGAIVAVLAVAGARSSLAADGEAGSWLFGVGVGTKPDYEGSNDYKLAPVGRFKFNMEGGRFIEAGGNHGSGKAVRLRANLLADSAVTLGPVLQYRPARSDVTNNFVHRMPTVDGALEAGGFVGLESGGWFFDTTAGTEVSQAAKSGITVELSAGYRAEASENLRYAIGAASTWADDDYMQTYFGVNGAQSAQSLLPTYSADSSFKDVGGSLMLDWRGSDWEHWSIQTIASYFRLIGDADDSSPIVDVGSADQLFGGLMFVYSN
jgi:outer membrane scaffolding protein for murein synthesis (MipA/OmpV family)